MTKRSSRKASQSSATESRPTRDRPANESLRHKTIAALGVALTLLIGGLVYWAAPAAPGSLSLPPLSPPPASASTPTAQADAATHVGAGVCRNCHESEFKAWSGSHHQQAMQEATSATVLGDFANARFRHKNVESLFFKNADGKFMVRTDGPEGKLVDYPVSYTFGVYPLQQYLIAFPGGRYQALPIAWDARPESEGGQRWFHLQPGQKIDHKDPLHWTGIYQNWQLQCAECHSTNLKKGYDAATATYKTSYSEINVACESCHGPGSAHVSWAEKAKPPYAAQENKGLPSLQTRWQEAWKFPDGDAKFAVHDALPTSSTIAAMNTCAACHSRRATLHESRKAGAPLEDTHRLALLTAPNYHADGQQREEVYVWGSFLQSKMYQRGVTCMDCHEPHGQKLRAEGNALCTRCHAANEFDAPKHHQHKAGGKGAQCVNCHMPRQNYMVIHARPDHSLRVPRPDLSVSLDSPNACNQCHTDKKPQWAASAMDKWYGKTWRERPNYGATLHAAETQGLRALPDLLALANNSATPAIVRATALTLAQPFTNTSALQTAQTLLLDANPSVRIAALGMIAPTDAPSRTRILSPLLADPIRGVRIEAARILADIPEAEMPTGWRAAREIALQEYVASLEQEADWPSANVNLGNLRLKQGRTDDAVAAYKRAIALDPGFVGGYINLADSWRQLGNETESEKVLRQGLAALPRDADLHYTLGLLLTRKGERAQAMKALAAAARLAPDNARYAYVEAIALHSAGQVPAALAQLQRANKRHPNDLSILSALVSINREAGNQRAALGYARQAAEILPEDENVRRLVVELEGK